MLTACKVCDYEEMQALLKLIQLKQKLLIRLIALFFLLAPLVNISLSFLGSGVPEWYQLSTLGSFLKSVPALDYLCLLGLLLAGVLLLLNKSFSLYAAGLIFLSISIFGVFRIFDNDLSSITEVYLKTYTLAGTALNIMILVLLGILIKKKNLS